MKRKSGFIFDSTPLFPQCHGSTIETLPDGKLMAAWFGGTREAHPDTAIYGSTLDVSQNEWNEPCLLAKVSAEPHWNPVLFRDASNNMHLFFKVGSTPVDWITWHSEMKRGEKSFSSPKLLVQDDISGGRGPVRNKPIILSDGSWLAPGSHERKVVIPPNKTIPSDVWDSFVDRSDDCGETWSRSLYVGRPSRKGGVIQPTVWESSNGNVHMFMRSTAGYVYRSDSQDYGRTWTEPKSTGVPNNNSSVDVCEAGFGLLAMAYNPVSGNWAARTPISLAFSKDNGDTWTEPISIEHSFASKAGFAYPSLTRSPKGIYMSYTWNRVGIRCIEIEVDTAKEEPSISIVEDMSVPELMVNRMNERKRAIIARAWGQANS